MVEAAERPGASFHHFSGMELRVADCNRKDHRGTTAASGLAWDLREAGTSCSVGVSSEEP